MSTRDRSVHGLRPQAVGVDVHGTLVERWLVFRTPGDVSGAKTAGFSAAWVKPKPDAVSHPWGVEPNLVVAPLEELAGQLATAA